MELEGKVTGDEGAFIPSAAPGWAGGEGSHRATKPNGVIHRYVLLPQLVPVQQERGDGISLNLAGHCHRKSMGMRFNRLISGYLCLKI